MREELAKRVGLRGRFTATFNRRAARSNGFGTVVTALFLDVRDEANTLVTDHAWMLFGYQMEKLQLKPGDRVFFWATVAEYTKADPDVEDWDEREWGPRPRKKDYRLSHLTGIRLVNCTDARQPAPEMPLFEQPEGI